MNKGWRESIFFLFLRAGPLLAVIWSPETRNNFHPVLTELICELIWFRIMTVEDLKTGCDRLIVRRWVYAHFRDKESTRVLSKAPSLTHRPGFGLLSSMNVTILMTQELTDRIRIAMVT